MSEEAGVDDLLDGRLGVVCELGITERGERKLEWVDLGALSLTHERIDGGVASTYPVALAGQIEDLARRENSCCGSWLTASVARAADTVRLEVTTENPDGLGVILSMAGLDSSRD